MTVWTVMAPDTDAPGHGPVAVGTQLLGVIQLAQMALFGRADLAV